MQISCETRWLWGSETSTTYLQNRVLKLFVMVISDLNLETGWSFPQIKIGVNFLKYWIPTYIFMDYWGLWMCIICTKSVPNQSRSVTTEFQRPNMCTFWFVTLLPQEVQARFSFAAMILSRSFSNHIPMIVAQMTRVFQSIFKIKAVHENVKIVNFGILYTMPLPGCM